MRSCKKMYFCEECISYELSKNFYFNLSTKCNVEQMEHTQNNIEVVYKSVCNGNRIHPLLNGWKYAVIFPALRLFVSGS